MARLSTSKADLQEIIQPFSSFYKEVYIEIRRFRRLLLIC